MKTVTSNIPLIKAVKIKALLIKVKKGKKQINFSA